LDKLKKPWFKSGVTARHPKVRSAGRNETDEGGFQSSGPAAVVRNCLAQGNFRRTYSVRLAIFERGRKKPSRGNPQGSALWRITFQLLVNVDCGSDSRRGGGVQPKYRRSEVDLTEVGVYYHISKKHKQLLGEERVGKEKKQGTPLNSMEHPRLCEGGVEKLKESGTPNRVREW